MSERPYFIINVEAAIFFSGKYLLIRRGANEEHSPGTLSLPGGKVDQLAVSPEALEQAVRREIHEEVGLTLGSLHYLESKSFVMDTSEWCVSVCFFCQDTNGDASIKSSDEVQEIVWCKTEELVAGDSCPPWTKQSIHAAENLRLKLENK